MTVLAIAAAYLAGAVVTYGVCSNQPGWFEVDGIADEMRTERPGVSERQIQHAAERGHTVMSRWVAVAWPIALVALAVAWVYDLTADGFKRARHDPRTPTPRTAPTVDDLLCQPRPSHNPASRNQEEPMTPESRKCVLCSDTGRDGQPRDRNWVAENTQTCTGHAERTAGVLDSIPGQWVMLTAAPGSGNGQARVSGSGEQPLGVRVPVLDLMSPANTGGVHDDYGDQEGTASVASVLAVMVDDWIQYRGKSERRPVPTVTRLCEWLLDRLGWALSEHPALPEFSHDLYRLLAAMRAANGDLPSEDEHKDGIECPRCDRMALYDVPEHEYIECVEPAGCGKLLKPTEYYQWVRLKEYFLRGAIPCPQCGTCTLTGARKIGRSECIAAKGGCGAVLEWPVYQKWAEGVAAVEKSGLFVWGEHHPLPGPKQLQQAA